MWFQETDSEAPDRQRWHLDISVPHEVAEQRIQAALDAGGTLVDDERAPAFWVLADPDGNQACICTWQSPRLTASGRANLTIVGLRVPPFGTAGTLA